MLFNIMASMPSPSTSGKRNPSNDISDIELLEFLVGYSNNNCSPDENDSKFEENSIETETLICDNSVDESRGLLERWEPGEILEDKDQVKTWSLNNELYQKQSDVFIVHEKVNTSTSSVSSTSHSAPCTPKKRGPRPRVLTPQEKRQKRVDANDRERQRMGKLNTAFDSLRHLLPKHGNDRELSKFETIQIAKNYIKALNQMLIQSEQDPYFHEHNNNRLNEYLE